MLYHKVSIAVLVILWFSITYAQVATIVSTPRSMNISSNSVAVFNCTAVATDITWNLNDIAIGDFMFGSSFTATPASTVPGQPNKNLRESTLTVSGSPDIDGVKITCLAISILTNPISFVESNPAQIYVQGPLHSVRNLSVFPLNSTTLLISWSPPFTLEGVPILGYTITITNTTSGGSTTREALNSTQLLYSITHPDTDNNFTVTVVALNEAGLGEPSTSYPITFSSSETEQPSYVQTLSTGISVAVSTPTVVESNTVMSVHASPMTTISLQVLVTHEPTGINSTIAIPVIIVTVLLVMVILIITLILLIAMVVLRIKRKVSTSRVIIISGNPVYEQVTINSITLQDNSAYSSVHNIALHCDTTRQHEQTGYTDYENIL